MTNSEIINRGYNLMITVALFLIGLGMAPYAVGEGGVDRLDDLGLPVVGLAAVLWYLAGGSRFKRSVVPPALVVLALAVQILGVVLEVGDRDAIGDNVAGMVMLLLLTAFAFWQYLHQPAWIGGRAGELQPAGETIHS